MIEAEACNSIACLFILRKMKGLLDKYIYIIMIYYKYNCIVYVEIAP